MQEAPVQVPAATYEQQYQRARVLLAAGQPDLAIAAFSALLAQSPANADVLLGRGIAYTRNKQYGEAERDLRAAAAAAPDYPDVWQALASV
ncbi:MAG TPA: tetratricopeptide repeat protein, partial [Burkholderiaceae bacterium]